MVPLSPGATTVTAWSLTSLRAPISRRSRPGSTTVMRSRPMVRSWPGVATSKARSPTSRRATISQRSRAGNSPASRYKPSPNRHRRHCWDWAGWACLRTAQKMSEGAVYGVTRAQPAALRLSLACAHGRRLARGGAAAILKGNWDPCAATDCHVRTHISSHRPKTGSATERGGYGTTTVRVRCGSGAGSDATWERNVLCLDVLRMGW